MTIQERLKHLREQKGNSQAEIAAYLGPSAQHYGKYELGKTDITFERAVQLADYYNVSLDYLAGRTEIKQFADDIIADDTLSRISDYDISVLAELFTELANRRKENK